MVAEAFFSTQKCPHFRCFIIIIIVVVETFVARLLQSKNEHICATYAKVKYIKIDCD